MTLKPKKSKKLSFFRHVIPVLLNLQCGVLLFIGIDMPFAVTYDPAFSSHLSIAPVNFWVFFYSGFGALGYLSLFWATYHNKPRIWVEWCLASGVVFFILASLYYQGVGTIMATGVSINALLGINSWLQSIGLAEYGVVMKIPKQNHQK